MKQKDIVTILVISFLSLVVSIVATKYLFATSAHRQQKVEVVPAISSNFSVPSSQYFNSQSIDPTQVIQIGNNSNPTPFNSSNH